MVVVYNESSSGNSTTSGSSGSFGGAKNKNKAIKPCQDSCLYVCKYVCMYLYKGSNEENRSGR